METTFMGGTGVRVSEIAMGTMSFGGDADEETAASLFAAARDAGVNLFDTANVYNGGRSEEILGNLIQSCRDEIVLATKAYFPTSQDGNARGTSRYHLVRAVEASLHRLQTDRIDLFYLHRWDAQTELDETLRALEHLVASGKVLYPAVSNFSAWQTMKACGLCDRLGLQRPVAMQPMYNLVKRQAEVEILPLAGSERIAVFPYSPLAGGLLTGKYRGGARPEAARLSHNEMYKTRYAAALEGAVASEFVALSEEVGVSPVTLAVAWVRHHPQVTAPIIGGRSVAQIEPALLAGSFDMDDALYARIAALTPTPPPATDRNEESSPNHYGSR